MRQVAIRWAEIMSPFRDTMSFIDRDTRKLPLPVNRFKSSTERFRKHQFWCDVEETSLWVTYFFQPLAGNIEWH